jgi:hypothetical protein
MSIFNVVLSRESLNLVENCAYELQAAAHTAPNGATFKIEHCHLLV